MKPCPKCRKISVDNALWCDCGYKWPQAKKEQKFSNDKINNDYELEIINLKKSIDDLREKGQKAVASRDKWRRRAEIAERKQNEQPQNNGNKFKQVKKMFSKMYHPDSLNGDKFEKLIKQEIFKEFWQIIESIEKNNT